MVSLRLAGGSSAKTKGRSAPTLLSLWTAACCKAAESVLAGSMMVHRLGELGGVMVLMARGAVCESVRGCFCEEPGASSEIWPLFHLSSLQYYLLL